MRLTNLLLLSSLLLPAVTSLGSDWTHWRGPEQTGISREKNLPDTFSLEDNKNVLWVSDVGGRSAPIILNDRVYLACRTPEDFNDPKERIHCREQVVCLDAKTGKTLWSDRFNASLTDIDPPRFGWASMAGDKETGYVYAKSVAGALKCYDGESGKLIWDIPLLQDYGHISGYGGRTQSPIIDEDRVIISFLASSWGEFKGPGPKHYYYAFDKRTGKLLWISAPGGAPYDTCYSVPIVQVINGTRMLIGGNGDGGVYAIHARTGEKIWGYELSLRGLNASVTTEGSRIFAAHGEDNPDSMDFGSVRCIDGTGRGNVTKTHTVWRKDGIKAGSASLVAHDGILYALSDTGMLNAMDTKDGKVLWTHSIGTVGKGSPSWADGKLYVMEVNGHIHILKPSREKCETLCKVQLPATKDKGWDEIYASPSIANGRVYFVTRDRTICVGFKDWKPASDPIPAMPEEKAPTDKVATLQLFPYETTVWAGESVEYELRGYDANGALIRKSKPALTKVEGLPGATLDGAKITTSNSGKDQGGTVHVDLDGLSGHARLRVFPPLPWKYDFEEFKGKDVPPAWLRAFIKMQPIKLGDSTVMRMELSKGAPGHIVCLGPANMKDYVIQADAMSNEKKRRISSVGLSSYRYTFLADGNRGQLVLRGKPGRPRLLVEKSFQFDPNVWYTLKFDVEVKDGTAKLKGKIWKRGEQEPGEWSIEAEDPHPNPYGSPGLYVYVLDEAYFDNVIVTKRGE